MKTEEKIYTRKIITEFWYDSGNTEELIDRLCRLVDWDPLNLGGRMNEEQQSEIEHYLRNINPNEVKAKESVTGVCLYCNDRHIEIKKAKACNRCYQRERNREKREAKAKKRADAKRLVLGNTT